MGIGALLDGAIVGRIPPEGKYYVTEIRDYSCSTPTSFQQHASIPVLYSNAPMTPRWASAQTAQLPILTNNE
jgi:hypothetical protein